MPAANTAIRIFAPPAEDQSPLIRQRTTNPLSTFGQQIAAEYADCAVSAADRQRALTEMTLTEFYGRWLRPQRVLTLDPKTVRADEDALAWFASVSIPADWPSCRSWSGPPIACITARWMASLTERSLDSGLAANTAGKHLRHLRTMLNQAHKLGLIGKLSITIPVEDSSARPFTRDEVESVYRALGVDAAMQVAWVVALATGARFSDLFWLDWGQIDFERRQVHFVAVKTNKHQVVPLASIPIAHLQRLPRHSPPFSRLVDQSTDQAWRSENYRTRRLNERWHALTGIRPSPRRRCDRRSDDVPHPWHSARATAGNWIEEVAAGMGSRLLGHVVSSGERVTRRHYLVPLVPADLRAAAESIVWPECFHAIPDPYRERQKLLFDI